MTINDATIIIADDLTGANDTALQYFKNGKKTKIITDINQEFTPEENIEVWSISTESRNIDKESAAQRVAQCCEKLKAELNVESFYKKIDSTLRGNVGVEIVTALETTQKDAAIVVPAYIEEGRTTVGSYQLLNGLPIERTQCALDPKAPIFESYIPDIIRKDLNSNLYNLIASIGLNVVSKGAALIIKKIKELIENDKKIIVIDAMSNTDLEQIAFAISKCGYDILPCGSAGLANAINNISCDNAKIKPIEHTPKLAKLIVSGSATQLTSVQITKLKEEKKELYSIDLTTQDIISEVNEDKISEIAEKLRSGIDVIIHSSNINKELTSEEAENLLIDEGIAKNEFAGKITDYLANLTHEISLLSNFILIIVGGETSYKCAQKLDCKYLEILDAIMPAIPLCIDMHGRIVVTKSGNFGNSSTLVDIMNYFEYKTTV